MVTKGTSQSGDQQGSQRVVAGTGDQFKQKDVAGGENAKESSEGIPQSIGNQRAPYSDPIGSSSLLLLESKVRRATPQVPANQDTPKKPVALQRWLSQNSDFPEYWHSHGGSEEKREEGRTAEALEKADEERRRRYKELNEYPQGPDT